MNQAMIVVAPGFVPSVPSTFTITVGPAPEGLTSMTITVPQTESYALPDRLWLLGGGRHRSTKQLRRMNRFGRRAFVLGGLSIRPNRRVDVTPKFIADHLEEIIARVAKGTLLVQHHADSFVDADELRAIAALVRGETPVGPVVKPESKPVAEELETDEDKKTAEDWDPTAGDGLDDDPGGDEQPQTPAEPPAAPPEAPSEPQAPADGAMDLSESEPVATAPISVPPMNDDEPLPAETPVDLPEDDLPLETKRELPEGWRTRTKAELLALCDEHGIQVDDRKAANKKLIDLLDAWLRG